MPLTLIVEGEMCRQQSVYTWTSVDPLEALSIRAELDVPPGVPVIKLEQYRNLIDMPDDPRIHYNCPQDGLVVCEAVFD
ncbi:hypothetical protein J6590_055466 [Homalodisca vitripennis]|nr:hypothetical protein J6590_055466 [Homalodisca vitripennis]